MYDEWKFFYTFSKSMKSFKTSLETSGVFWVSPIFQLRFERLHWLRETLKMFPDRTSRFWVYKILFQVKVTHRNLKLRSWTAWKKWRGKNHDCKDFWNQVSKRLKRCESISFISSLNDFTDFERFWKIVSSGQGNNSLDIEKIVQGQRNKNTFN